MSKEDLEEMKQPLHQLLAVAEQAIVEAMGYPPDWKYVDLPRMTEEYFDEFVASIGEDNIQWLTIANYVDDGVVTKRGQVLISPEGMKNIQKAYK